MPPLHSAKRRARRRRHGEGAALFVVSMTIAVLASVGIYALAAASNEVKTSGYERQNTQTHYLATYGVIGAAHEIMGSKADFYLGLMRTRTDFCPGSLPNVPATAPIELRQCYRLGSPELGQPWTGASTVDTYTGTVPYQSGVAPGSFGPTPTQGDFFVELTDAYQGPPASRYGLGNFCFTELTATSTGLTRPTFATANDTAMYGAEGLEMQRARLQVGPTVCHK